MKRKITLNLLAIFIYLFLIWAVKETWGTPYCYILLFIALKDLSINITWEIG